MGAAHVYDDRRVDLAAVPERDPGDPVAAAADLHNLIVEHELGATHLGRALEVVARELGVVDVARPGGEDRSAELGVRGIPEVGIGPPLGWPERAGDYLGLPTTDTAVETGRRAAQEILSAMTRRGGENSRSQLRG